MNAKSKANASQGIPELLEISVGKYFRKNEGNKHKRSAAQAVTLTCAPFRVFAFALFCFAIGGYWGLQKDEM